MRAATREFCIFKLTVEIATWLICYDIIVVRESLWCGYWCQNAESEQTSLTSVVSGWSTGVIPLIDDMKGIWLLGNLMPVTFCDHGSKLAISDDFHLALPWSLSWSVARWRLYLPFSRYVMMKWLWTDMYSVCASYIVDRPCVLLCFVLFCFFERQIYV